MSGLVLQDYQFHLYNPKCLPKKHTVINFVFMPCPAFKKFIKFRNGKSWNIFFHSILVSNIFYESYSEYFLQISISFEIKYQNVGELQLEETYHTSSSKFNWRLIFFVTPKKCYWHNKQRSISLKKNCNFQGTCFQKLNEIMNSLCHMKLFLFQNTLNHHLNISVTNDKKKLFIRILVCVAYVSALLEKLWSCNLIGVYKSSPFKLKCQ